MDCQLDWRRTFPTHCTDIACRRLESQSLSSRTQLTIYPSGHASHDVSPSVPMTWRDFVGIGRRTLSTGPMRSALKVIQTLIGIDHRSMGMTRLYLLPKNIRSTMPIRHSNLSTGIPDPNRPLQAGLQSIGPLLFIRGHHPHSYQCTQFHPSRIPPRQALPNHLSAGLRKLLPQMRPWGQQCLRGSQP